MATTAIIITPKGKPLTDRQYLALHRAQLAKWNRNYHSYANDCDQGHVACAAWLGGPCSDEVAERVNSQAAP